MDEESQGFKSLPDFPNVVNNLGQTIRPLCVNYIETCEKERSAIPCITNQKLKCNTVIMSSNRQSFVSDVPFVITPCNKAGQRGPSNEK